MITATKKLYIKTWGCQMNVYDSKRMADVLRSLGYAESDTPEDADMIILNTCHIREKATDKVFSEIGRLREHKKVKEKNGGRMLMAVAGCVAQAEGDFILKRAPEIDMVFGPQTYHELPEMVLKASGMIGRPRIVNTDFPVESKFDHLPIEFENQSASAYLSIQEGCDKFCTFCVVPYTRGAEYSRPVKDIVEEARKLVEAGAKEIILLGQNVNAYHGTGHNGSTASLADLIYEVDKIYGVARIRYSTSHPRDMDDALIQSHSLEKNMPFLHLPVQSGSDKILKAMNRKHGRDLFFEVVEKVKAVRPDITFSSDFIIGFPGETDADFEDTMDLVRRTKFSSAYSFKYSPRPGTPAANMPKQLHESVKSERLQTLQALLNEQQYEFNMSCEGKVLPVLFDRKGYKQGQLLGRSPYFQSVNIAASDTNMNQICNVKIIHAAPNSLTGELVPSDIPMAAE
jgi:tRNA-2-methylthio-N6-dimethylallyladenosine synthase